MDDIRDEKYESLWKCLEAYIVSIQDKPGTCRNLSKSFPLCTSECPEVIQLISDHFWKNFSDNLKGHMTALVDELDLKSLLRKVEEGDISKWRMTGKPRQDLNSMLSVFAGEQEAALQEMIEESKAEVDSMKAELKKTEDEVKALMQEVEEGVEKLEEISDVCAKGLAESPT